MSTSAAEEDHPLIRNIQTMTTLGILEKVASFYGDPEQALTVLIKWAKSPGIRPFNVETLYYKEHALFLTRCRLRTVASVETLECNLDLGDVARPTGYGIGLEGYEAEMYYQG